MEESINRDYETANLVEHRRKLSRKLEKNMSEGSVQTFSYTPLNTSREWILMKCSNIKFKEVVIGNPYLVRQST